MSFSLYHRSDKTYTRIQPITLTGADGLIARFLQSQSDVETPYAWDLTTEKLVELIDPSLCPNCHEIVLDMLPEEMIEVCLYKVTAIRGSSDLDESDLVLAFKVLFQGRTGVSSSEYKKEFTLENEGNNRQMLEAFRLTGGIQKGSYRWAAPKMNIGAAVCPANA